MSLSPRALEPEHRAEIVLEVIHAIVVLAVVAATTIIAYTNASAIPTDTVGVVYGAAIGYASGRAGSVHANGQRSRRRVTDPP